MDNFRRQIRRLALRLIESLLKLYPPRFRHEFYSEIETVILSRLHDTELGGHWVSTVFQEIAGLVASIIQERWHELRFRKEIGVNIVNEKPRWFFYVGWVVLNVISLMMAWYIASAIISQVTKIVGGTIQVGGHSRITEDFLLMNVLLPITGLLTGIFQYLLLRRYLPHMTWWIAATLVSWSTLLLIRFLIPFLAPSNSTLSLILGLLLIGATMALPQWWMLRQRVPHASWWFLAYGLGWGMVGLLNLVTSEPVPVFLTIALVPAITTAIACWLLLDWLPNRELKSSLSSL